MIPKRITQLWFGEPMPERLLNLCEGVRTMNPGWVYCRLGDDDLKPFGLRADRLKDEFGNWAAVSNFVRLLVLQRVGGVYLDTDFQALKPLDPLLALGDCLAAEQDGGRICNAFMAATPNHPWVNWQLANRARYEQKDAASGVYLATDAPRDGLTIVPQHLVYPWLYTAPESERVPHVDSLLMHGWEGSWVKP